MAQEDNHQAEEHYTEDALPENPDELDSKRLGIAGRITRAFIESPITPLMMAATLAVGFLGLLFTPRQEDPQISVPMIDIFVQYQGASAEQVASLVTDPLNRIMSEIPGIKHVYSATMRGQAMTTVRFEVGEPLGPSIVKVHDKVQSNLDMMPPGVSMPLVKPKGVDDVPVVTLTLWSKDVDDGALRTLALDVLQRLQEVPNTGQGFVVGGRAEQIRVEVYPERLSGYGISLDQIGNTIRTANAEQEAGRVESGGGTFTVYTGSFLRTADEVSRLVIGTRNGAPIYVRDVARVFHGPEDASRMVAYYTGPAHEALYEGGIFGNVQQEANGEPAVTIALAKKEGSNGVTVANAILAKLEQLQGSLIPDNVNVTITRDYGKTANDKVNELLMALFEAALAVTVLCLIGLGTRAAFVVITVIPIVILITIFSAWVLDYTIDRVSLFALIFAIGILVDDATVVVENIFRRWMEHGKTSVVVAIDAVREVGNPTILATLTIVSALLPMGFVRGLMGPYMRPIPVLGSSAMMWSLIAAFIFTPWFAMRVRPGSVKAFEKQEHREKATQRFVGKIYDPLIWPLIRHRFLGVLFLFAIIGVTALCCVMFYTQAVTVKMLPFDNKPEFNVVINMPEGTAMPETANVAYALTEALRKIPEVTALQSYVGTASPFNFNGLVRHYYLRQHPWEGDIQVMLVDKNERERPSHAIAEAARHQLTPIAAQFGAKIQVVEMPPGPPVLQTITAEVYGPNAATRRQFATDLESMFEAAPNVVDVDTYIADPYTYWRFEIDTEKAIRRGISVDVINRNVAMAMGGYKLGDVKRAAPLEPTYIVIQTPLAVRSQITSLTNLPIPSTTGQVVPLGELGNFVEVPEDPYIYHKDLRPMEYVTAEGEGRLGAPIYGMFQVEDQLENYTTPDGVKVTGMPWGLIGPPATDQVSGIEWTGEWTVTYETFRDMGTAFMAALLLIYALIVVEFRNYALSGLIMAPIPLTLIGIIPGHWLMGADFTATSMIGMIALGGIIVRVSILIVEFVKHEYASGKNIQEAAVTAARTRFRPIMITSGTLMAGAFMILGDPIFEGMAVSLFFGTMAGTLFTLIVIPMGCISAEKHFQLLTGRYPTVEPGSETAEVEPVAVANLAKEPKTPLLLLIWGKVITIITMTFYIIRAVFIMLREGILKIIGLFRRPPRGGGTTVPPPPGPSSPPPPSSQGSGGAASPAGAGAVTASAATVSAGLSADSASLTLQQEDDAAALPTGAEEVGREALETSAPAGEAVAGADRDSAESPAEPESGPEAVEAVPEPQPARIAAAGERKSAPAESGQARKRRGIRLLDDMDADSQ